MLQNDVVILSSSSAAKYVSRKNMKKKHISYGQNLFFAFCENGENL